MIKVTQQQWNKISNDYKGEWDATVFNYRGDVPKDYIGKRTVLSGCISADKGSLLTEGIHFEIV
jgi:hypothetical protein